VPGRLRRDAHATRLLDLLQAQVSDRIRFSLGISKTKKSKRERKPSNKKDKPPATVYRLPRSGKRPGGGLRPLAVTADYLVTGVLLYAGVIALHGDGGSNRAVQGRACVEGVQRRRGPPE
jgi:hypothetical protein